MNNFLVSIHCITYNHAKFIKQTLDGFVMQKTNFKFQVIIGDDCSTDGTTEIIKEYEKKYPDIIKPIYHSKNNFAKNKFDVNQACNTKYVALCEGDDYWTDEYKLQKQIDFLEQNPEFSICFHPVKVIWEDNSQPSEIFPAQKDLYNKTEFTIEDLLIKNFMQTNSVVYRWGFNDEDLNEIFPQEILPEDWFLHLLHAQKGKIKYIDECMSVYRKHKNGIWNGANSTDKWFLTCGRKNVRFYCALKETFKKDTSTERKKILLKTTLVYLKHGKIKDIIKLVKEFKDIYKEIILNLPHRFFILLKVR